MPIMMADAISQITLPYMLNSKKAMTGKLAPGTGIPQILR
jgi:hypothetical protein